MNDIIAGDPAPTNPQAEAAVRSLINGGYGERQAREIMAHVAGEAQEGGYQRGRARALAEAEVYHAERAEKLGRQLRAVRAERNTAELARNRYRTAWRSARERAAGHWEAAAWVRDERDGFRDQRNGVSADNEQLIARAEKSAEARLLAENATRTAQREVKRLRARVVELEARQSRAEVLRDAATVAGEMAEELRSSGGEMAEDREAGAVAVSVTLFALADEAEAGESRG